MKKVSKKKQAVMTTKLVFGAENNTVSEDEECFDGGGMFLDRAALRLIYNALSDYKPAEVEEHLRGILLEQFEEVLVNDYDEPVGVN